MRRAINRGLSPRVPSAGRELRASERSHPRITRNDRFGLDRNANEFRARAESVSRRRATRTYLVMTKESKLEIMARMSASAEDAGKREDHASLWSRSIPSVAPIRAE